MQMTVLQYADVFPLHCAVILILLNHRPLFVEKLTACQLRSYDDTKDNSVPQAEINNFLVYVYNH